MTPTRATTKPLNSTRLIHQHRHVNVYVGVASGPLSLCRLASTHREFLDKYTLGGTARKRRRGGRYIMHDCVCIAHAAHDEL